ncbi:hypothetical protein AB5J62_15120 [Amycolatopsis sp. cg5]|uniref:hypothetical protein n=1 Tax=Amycolatopsis sp. cg5 TaxID=3238802 RepID=UPI00352407E8
MVTMTSDQCENREGESRMQVRSCTLVTIIVDELLGRGGDTETQRVHSVGREPPLLIIRRRRMWSGPGWGRAIAMLRKTAMRLNGCEHLLGLFVLAEGASDGHCCDGRAERQRGREAGPRRRCGADVNSDGGCWR